MWRRDRSEPDQVIGAELLALAGELVAIPSESRHEAELADLVERWLRSCRWLEVHRIGDNVVARTKLGRTLRLIVAGHLDTVPPGAEAARVEDGTLFGLGAADMKGGLAVMLDLARSVPEPFVDVTWCFYAREEIGRDESGLEQLWRVRPDLLIGDAAVLGEPTDCQVEAGCQGSLRSTLTLAGVRAHTARPFTGRNAVHRLAPVLSRVAEWEGRSIVLGGCEYTEQLQVVNVNGGVAGNVVPDLASITLNYRFAPDRDPVAAQRFVEGLVADVLDESAGDRMTIEDLAPAAPPALDHPLLAALVAASGGPPRAKVGWTDVASFGARGVPAANFGPGDPLLAHHPDERVDAGALSRARAVLGHLLT